ncbi:restriction endonuclease subunit S [Bacillus cereus]|nr:restriction endonuclease subunit S [Bacillus cereus]MDA2079720.1 restriction endonuclease subunit S [Bacillus cereus]MDA2085320.1 restriction endonuclease subunit S [Bacillus cereus]
MKNKRTPDIRFEGFTRDWEQRRLSEVSERVRGNDGRMDLPTLTMSASAGWLDQRERFSGNIAGNEQKNYTLLSVGELSYNHGNSKLAKYGVVFKLRTFKEALVPRVYHSFKTTKDANADFIEYMFETKLPDRELGKLVSSGARMDGLLNINYDDFMGIKIKLPTIQEQEKIGIFLRDLDNLITLHQQELTTLKQTKQGFLQKMFPKEAESVPEVRFPGFTGDWEERKFKDDIVSIQTGTNLLGSKSNGGTPLIKMGNIQRGYFSLDKLEYLDDSEIVSELDIINNGDFLFNTRNTLELVGKGATWFYESGKYAFNSNIARFTFKNINTYFFNYLYNTEQVIRQVRARAVGTTSVAAVYPRDLNSMKYMVPSIEEQSEIGNFFRQLDYTITLHHRELEALKEAKKAFLQKFFV